MAHFKKEIEPYFTISLLKFRESISEWDGFRRRNLFQDL